MKTQINRLETKVMGNKSDSDSEISGIRAKLETIDGMTYSGVLEEK